MDEIVNVNCAEHEEHTTVIGNSLDIDINPCMHDSEIRADVVVNEKRAIRIWGQIRNCDGEGVDHALVKLIRIVHEHRAEKYIGVAHTVTDCNGFYQFDICLNQCGCYKILVGKADTGSEYVIPESHSDCNPCRYDVCPDEKAID